MTTEKYYNLQAIVLRTHDYKEHDKLVRLFSLERGRITGLAKGAGKPTGSLRGLVQPFTQVNLTLARGRGSLDIITQGQVERPFISLRQDLAKIAYASYLAELTWLALPEGKPSAEVFMLLLAAFSLLDMDAEPRTAARFFELRLLQAIGLTPYLEACLSCGCGLAGRSFVLSPARGGLLCPTCAGADGGPVLSAGSVQTMRHMLTVAVSRLPQLKISAATQQQMEQALECYLNYHLEQAPKARAMLESLL